MAVEWVRLGATKRKVHVLANRAWRQEQLDGPRPILIALHDELRHARPRLLVERFAPLVYRPGTGDDGTGKGGGGGSGGSGGESPAGGTLVVKGLDLSHGHFVVVVPEGLQSAMQVAVPDPTGPDTTPNLSPVGAWNSGHRGFDAASLNTDDVGAIERMLHEVLLDFQGRLVGHPVRGLPRARAERALDPTQVFVVGHGNGAEMAFRLANELSEAADAAGRGYEVVVRGVGSYGGSHGGVESGRLGGGSLAAYWEPPAVDPPLAVLVHGEGDEDFFVEPVGAPDVPSDEVTEFLAEVGMSAVLPPSSATAHFSLASWVPLGSKLRRFHLGLPGGGLATDLRYVDPTSGALVARGLWRPDLDHAWPATQVSSPTDPAVVFWNSFASVLR